ncbi:shikimate kinase [Demequina sediminis]|uniref:shikimate kinase n=1 Tax=Demequina sediminis TaxID=1930058 RepID=UPI0033060FDB
MGNGPRAVLIGPPGSGKSTVAKALATLWDVERRDTDADIEATAGKEIAEIFVDDGEQAFRALERTAVATAVAEHVGVLSLGGGAVLAPETQALLEAYGARGERSCSSTSRSVPPRRAWASTTRARCWWATLAVSGST